MAWCPSGPIDPDLAHPAPLATPVPSSLVATRPPSRSPHWLLSHSWAHETSGEPEPEKAPAVRRVPPVAVGGPAAQSRVAPAATPDDAVRAIPGTCRVDPIRSGVLVIPVRAPLPHVAVHVIQAPPVGLQPPHWVRRGPLTAPRTPPRVSPRRGQPSGSPGDSARARRGHAGSLRDQRVDGRRSRRFRRP